MERYRTKMGPFASAMALAFATTAASELIMTTLPNTATAAVPSGQMIAEQGNGHGAPPCSTCHGEHFEGNPSLKAPRIAGLSANEILARLRHYASPAGHNLQMRQVATSLSPNERKAVATYLGGLGH
jgi:cytochrome c553